MEKILMYKKFTVKFFSFLFFYFFINFSFAETDSYDMSQWILLEKIRIFLRADGKDEEYIKKFAEGHCTGIASLWLYASWAYNYYPDPRDRPKYNHSWFYSTIRLLVYWDGESKFSEEEKRNIRIFIDKIYLFQNSLDLLSVPQGDLDKILDDKDGGKLNKVYSIASLFTLDQLEKFLKIEGIIQSRTLILITVHRHAVALFVGGEGFYKYFDANLDKGEHIMSSLWEVARWIFGTNGLDAQKPSPIGIRIFSFSNAKYPVGPYPSQEEVLNIINPSLVAEDGYKNGENGLMMAAKIGCLVSLEYFIEKGVNVDLRRTTGHTVLTDAIESNRLEVVRRLLAENVDISARIIDDQKLLSPVAFAVRHNNDTDILEKLLNYGADFYFPLCGGWKKYFEESKNKDNENFKRLFKEHGYDLD